MHRYVCVRVLCVWMHTCVVYVDCVMCMCGCIHNYVCAYKCGVWIVWMHTCVHA